MHVTYIMLHVMHSKRPNVYTYMCMHVCMCMYVHCRVKTKEKKMGEKIITTLLLVCAIWMMMLMILTYNIRLFHVDSVELLKRNSVHLLLLCSPLYTRERRKMFVGIRRDARISFYLFCICMTWHMAE